MSVQKNKRSENIQIIRALSIIAVVSIHAMPHTNADIYVRPLLNFCVAMFLFLSGYLTRYERVNDDYKGFAYKRIKKVLIPYLIWSVPYIILSKDYNILSVSKQLLLFKTNGIFYFVFVYIQLVLITPILFKLLNSSYYKVGGVLV